ncbi:MAG: hypothetical protein K6E33_05295, partial [Lachnospiraceae bacterium]|nr:hypothetical protein [Lachnospiraceae bacterium]
LAEAVDPSDTEERSSAKDIVDAAMADSRAGEHVANYMAVPDPVEAQYRDWLSTVSASEGNYLICVGRFVPENNYDVIIREFMACKKDMKLILITTINDALRESIDSELGFSKDPRVLISLPVYNERLLTRIRAGSFAYVHGHEVGGTNPSLLESLAASPLCLVLDVPFNHEVSADSGIYWTKEEGSLKNAIEKALAMTPSEKASVREKAIRRINEAYSWGSVIDRYEKLFKPASK